jgi:hypothetical protein
MVSPSATGAIGDSAPPPGSVNTTQRSRDSVQLEDAVSRRELVPASERPAGWIAGRGLPQQVIVTAIRRHPCAAVPVSRDRSTLRRVLGFTRGGELRSGAGVSQPLTTSLGTSSGRAERCFARGTPGRRQLVSVSRSVDTAGWRAQ